MIAVRSSAARTNCDYTVNDDDNEDDDGDDVALQSDSTFENLKILSRSGADFWILTPYRVEFIVKRWIFGLDTAIDR